MGTKFKQRKLTIHLACYYLDLLASLEMGSQEVAERELKTPESKKSYKRKMEIKALMCMMVASKYDELDDNIPLIRDFQKYSKFEFSYKELR